jgi:putative membrane protein
MSRRSFIAAGSIALGVAWIGPLPGLAEEAFFGHMTMHMIVVAIAAPLLALGIAGSKIDPVRRWPALFAAIPISLVELVVVWAWHAPALHHAAWLGPLGLVAEQGSFILCGLAVWLAAFGGDPEQRPERIGAGVTALLLTSMHMTLLGALLALSTRPLYPHAHGWGSLSPLDDQQLGGAIMLLVGGVSYMSGGLWLVAELLRGKRAEQRT